MRNAELSTGWVVTPGSQGARFAGTCFALHGSSVLLTARHNLANWDERNVTVSIATDRISHGLAVKRIDRHPSADLAVLHLESSGVFDHFTLSDRVPVWGEEICAFGYPEDTDDDGIRPTPRFFRGNIQRMFTHRGLAGASYLAAEMSFPAPAGMSGGPVAFREHPDVAIAVVVENKLASTYLHTVSEHNDAEGRVTERVHSTVEYGLAVLLEPLRRWLDTVARVPN